MRKVSKLFIGVATMATAAALVAGSVMTASADPLGPTGKPVTPAPFDIVGVGSNTTQYVLDQISVDYNKTIPASKHNAAHPYFYSWDAIKPGTDGTQQTFITPKQGCSNKTVRPNGSGAGVSALRANASVTVKGVKYWCVDFARSSGGRKPTDPAAGKGGILFVAFARDAVTWATRAPKFGGTNAPASLTLAQLKGIFTCTTKNWSAVGGKPGAIKVYLPQAGSGTLSFWEKTMGITALSSCVSQAPEENEGTNKLFNDPNAIFIFSIGSYIAQKYHSAFCNAKPTKTQNQFGCNLTGRLQLMDISGKAPTTSAKIPVTNPAFPATFFRTLYDVVRWGSAGDHIDGRLDKFFGSRARGGYMCSNPAAIAAIKNYGFIPTVACGSGS
jgi:ABC-type phosphate transport system substrate-binding protein